MIVLFLVFLNLLKLTGLNFGPYVTFSLWILFNCLDIYSTHFFMKHNGQEGNPIIKSLFKKIGFAKSVLLFKVPYMLIFGILFIEKAGPNRVLMAWNLVLVYVVIGNYLYGQRLKNNPP